MADPRTVKGVSITPSRFTAQAKDFAQNLVLELIEDKNGGAEESSLLESVEGSSRPLTWATVSGS